VMLSKRASRVISISEVKVVIVSSSSQDGQAPIIRSFEKLASSSPNSRYLEFIFHFLHGRRHWPYHRWKMINKRRPCQIRIWSPTTADGDDR
jgi:hypothetical protein